MKKEGRNRQSFGTSIGFDEDLKQWREGEILSTLRLRGFFRETEFTGWIEKTLNNSALQKCLRKLNSRYRILPSAVLNLLGDYWTWINWVEAFDESTYKKLATIRERKKVVVLLERTIKKLEELPRNTTQWSKPIPVDSLVAVKNLLDLKDWYTSIPSKKTGRPRDVKLHMCVQDLVDFFKSTIENRGSAKYLYKHVATLVRNAFPEKYWPGDKSDGKDAVLKVAKGMRAEYRQPFLEEAIAIQKNDRKYLGEIERQIKEFDRLIAQAKKKRDRTLVKERWRVALKMAKGNERLAHQNLKRLKELAPQY